MKMIRGLYTSTAGMLVNQKRSETIGENLDNLHTPGYREKHDLVEAFPQMLISRVGKSQGKPEAQVIGTIGTGATAEETAVKVAPGLIRETNLNTDVALASTGFFVVETVEGERYTRNGRFQLDPNGYLRTEEGHLVLGEDGPIGPLSADFRVEIDGTVVDQGQVVGRLRVVDIPGTALVREGKTSLYNATVEPVEVAQEDVRIRQGALEESNVDLNALMVDMITVARAYEANQRIVQANDETLQKAVNDIGRV